MHKSDVMVFPLKAKQNKTTQTQPSKHVASGSLDAKILSTKIRVHTSYFNIEYIDKISTVKWERNNNSNNNNCTNGNDTKSRLNI